MDGKDFFESQIAAALLTAPDNGHDPAPESEVEAGVAQEARPRRTLVIALGGTGQKVAVNLKALYQRYQGEMPEWLRLIVLDTANEPLEIALDDGSAIHLEPGTEFTNIGKVPVRRIIENREQQQAISERFGDALLHLSGSALVRGARQIRANGLLALLWHLSVVEEKIKLALWQLAGRDNQDTGVVDDEHGINVIIVNSLCGGTGAGMFLDIAFLVRELVNELGDLGEFCHITGVGLLPSAFPGVKGPNLLPNTVASLMELNHVMTHTDFTASYPNGRVIKEAGAPFDFYAVLDGVDEHGKVWPNNNAVCRLAARALYMQMGSHLGRRGESIFDNLEEILSQTTPDGLGTFFGSMGVSVIRFDARSAYDLCARYHALQVLEKGWLKALTEEEHDDLAEDVETFWATQRLASTELPNTLALDDQGMFLAVDVSLPGNIRRQPAADQAVSTAAYVKEYEGARLNGTFQRAIAARLAERISEVTTKLEAEIGVLSRDVNSGPLRAQAFLVALKGRMDGARTQLKQRAEELRAHHQALAGAAEDQRLDLLKQSKSGFLGRAARVATAQQDYLDTTADLFACHLDHQLVRTSLRLLDSLSQTRAALEHSVDNLISRLVEADRLITVAEPTTDSFDIRADLELVQPNYVHEIYQNLAPSLSATGLRLIEDTDGMLAWAMRPAAAFARALWVAAGEPFKSVLHWGIERVLQDQAGDVPPKTRRAFLLQQAIPSWNVDRSRMENGGAQMVSLAVLGVPDERDTIFGGDGDTLVSTHDENQMTALAITAGAPYSALQQFPVWRSKYEAVRGKHSLHVLPVFHTGESSALKGFALGLVFNLITTQGAWYYYRPQDQLEEKRKLGQGLSNAVKTFTTQEGLVQEVIERVERHVMSRMTTAQAIELLKGYYSAGSSTDDRLDRDLRRAAREYADELQQVLAASEGIQGPEVDQVLGR